MKDEILHGIPFGYLNDDKYRDMLVVTKAGGFGGEDALIQILNFLTISKCYNNSKGYDTLYLFYGNIITAITF